MSTYSYCMYIYIYIYIYIIIIIIVPAGTLRLPCLRFFRASSSLVRQMPGQNSQIRGTARTLPNFLCRSVYCSCVNVYCTTATGWLPNSSQQIYRKIKTIISSRDSLSFCLNVPKAMLKKIKFCS